MQKSLILLLALCLFFSSTAHGEEIILEEILRQYEENDTLFIETEVEADDPALSEANSSTPDSAGSTGIVVKTEPAESLTRRIYTPSYTSPFTDSEGTLDYWSLPMDITDEAAIWSVLTADMTVIHTGPKCTEKSQVFLRAQPDEASEKVGAVTCETQGVRVLETLDNGWSLIECYSSSFKSTGLSAWNMLVQGYVKTDWLKTISPDQEMGIVIDKLTQRMYIFLNGQLYDTLLVSTGLSNAGQPFNETRSGEFVTATKVGQFPSDNMRCAMAIRINAGDLIHEVPYILTKNRSHDYSATEGKLGTRASHGCIRVQRKKTSKGTNMAWLWKNIKNNSKVRVLIWEDWQGRQVPIPSDDTVIYYNPKSGNYYHAAETCSSAKNKVFTPATYGELQTSLSKLKRCPSCNPPLALNEINAINETHVLGGDHDPVITKARSKFIAYRSKLEHYLNDYYKADQE